MSIATLVIAILALVVSAVTFYFQFFHKSTILHINYIPTTRGSQFGIQVTLTNGGNSSIILSYLALEHVIHQKHQTVCYGNVDYGVAPPFSGKAIQPGEHAQFLFSLKAFDRLDKQQFIPVIDKGKNIRGYYIQLPIVFINSQGKQTHDLIKLGRFTLQVEQGFPGVGLDVEGSTHTINPNRLITKRSGWLMVEIERLRKGFFAGPEQEMSRSSIRTRI